MQKHLVWHKYFFLHDFTIIAERMWQESISSFIILREVKPMYISDSYHSLGYGDLIQQKVAVEPCQLARIFFLLREISMIVFALAEAWSHYSISWKTFYLHSFHAPLNS